MFIYRKMDWKTVVYSQYLQWIYPTTQMNLETIVLSERNDLNEHILYGVYEVQEKKQN